MLDNLEINRLSKWSVTKLSFASVGLQVNTIGRVIHGDDAYFGSLALDINTVPSYDGEFDRDVSASVFEELLHFAQEIAVEGDIA